MHFPWLLVESVSGINQSMLHVDCILTSSVVHCICLQSVTIGTLLDTLLSPLHILVTKWLEAVTILHVYLVKIWQRHMSSVLRLDDHVRRVTLMLASVIDSFLLQESLSPGDIHITICFLENACLWPYFPLVISSRGSDAFKAYLLSILIIFPLLLFLSNDLLPSNSIIKVTHMLSLIHISEPTRPY